MLVAQCHCPVLLLRGRGLAAPGSIWAGSCGLAGTGCMLGQPQLLGLARDGGVRCPPMGPGPGCAHIPSGAFNFSFLMVD